MGASRSRDFEKLKTWYLQGIFTVHMLQNMVAKGRITQDEYEEIINDIH